MPPVPRYARISISVLCELFHQRMWQYLAMPMAVTAVVAHRTARADDMQDGDACVEPTRSILGGYPCAYMMSIVVQGAQILG